MNIVKSIAQLARFCFCAVILLPLVVLGNLLAGVALYKEKKRKERRIREFYKTQRAEWIEFEQLELSNQ